MAAWTSWPPTCPGSSPRLAKLNPAPTRDIPVLIGGGGEKKTLKLVARHADIWHTFVSGAELDHKLAVLAGHCETIGRDVNEIEVSVAVRGNPVEDAQGVYDQGARLITYGVGGPEFDLEPLKALVAWRDKVNN